MTVKLHRFLGVLAAVVALSGPAAAYIGPGAGLSAIGTLLSLAGAVVLGIVGFLWYPIKRLLRAMRRSKSNPGAGLGPDTDQK